MTWLDELRIAALVGTGRHAAPSPPVDLGVRPPEGLSREEELLDQAAMADVVIRASRSPAHAPATTLSMPAPPDPEPEAAGEAARLLELLLTQPPVGLELRNQLVVDWLQLAEESRRRVPHRLLPALFALAETKSAVFRRLEPAIGTRGRWLQSLSKTSVPKPADESSELRSDLAAAELERLRSSDPATARETLATHWNALSARERANRLALLATNLGSDDEELLERALDDKAKSVREVATGLLDRLPGSLRAGRMAARLLSLVHLKGLLTKRIEIDLPRDPDEQALRDGIPSNQRGGEPDRLARLDTIIRGAPLEVWTSVSGRSPAATVELLEPEPRVLADVVRAHDGAVAHLSRQQHFATEPLDALGRLGQLGSQQLQRDVDAELLVARAVDHAHPPDAEQRLDPIAAREHRTGWESPFIRRVRGYGLRDGLGKRARAQCD